MARRIVFHADAWDDYLYWQAHDRKMIERIHVLIRECQRDPFQGIGKPEPLRGSLNGWWSRRIDPTHRLVYRASAHDLEIAACRYHYGAR